MRNNEEAEGKKKEKNEAFFCYETYYMHIYFFLSTKRLVQKAKAGICDAAKEHVFFHIIFFFFLRSLEKERERKWDKNLFAYTHLCKKKKRNEEKKKYRTV